MQPDLRRTRQALTRRYGVLIVLLLGGFALGVYAQVSRSQAAQARLQVEQLAQAAAAELPLLHHEHDEMERTDLPAWLREQAHAALVAQPIETLDSLDETDPGEHNQSGQQGGDGQHARSRPEAASSGTERSATICQTHGTAIRDTGEAQARPQPQAMGSPWNHTAAQA